MKIKTSNDLSRFRICVAIKNVMAIAYRGFHGLGYGDNLYLYWYQNSIREIEYFLSIVAPKERNLLDYVVFRHLMVTSYSQFSRKQNIWYYDRKKVIR